MVPKNKKSKIVVSAFALSALSAFAFASGANAAGVEDFPDEVFRDCVYYSYFHSGVPVYSGQDDDFLNVDAVRETTDDDEDAEEWLTPEQLAEIEYLYCSNKRISIPGDIENGPQSAMRGEINNDYIIHDITGIGLLPNLKGAYLVGNAVAVADLSDNTNLEEIDLSSNNIESIILPRSDTLRMLVLDNNKIREIDLSVVPQLTVLHMSNNLLRSIDLSNNSLLQFLLLDDNNLEDLDLSHNPYLYAVSLLNNAFLPYADFSNNPLLVFFRTIEVPFYLGNKAFEDEDGKVKVRLDNIEFTGEASQPSDDDSIIHGTPGFGGGDIITGLPDVDEPVSPEMTFIDVLETDEYHVEVDDNGVRTVVFDDFNEETSNIVNLAGDDGTYRLVINFAAVREEGGEETPEDVPAVPDTGIFTDEETGRELGAVALALAIASSVSFVVVSIINRIRKRNSVRKF